jgi:diguanylate cyclase (GGDEF)-like protein
VRFVFLLLLLLTSLWGELQKVSVQLEWKYQYEFAGFVAAKEQGYYRDAGLDVELREYNNNVDIVSDVLNHKATYGVYNSSIVTHNGRIEPIVLLATYLQHSPLVFVAQKGIKNPTDMIGKKIMCTAEESKYSSLALLLNYFGITSKNTHIIKHSFTIKDFIDKKVDVMSAFRSNEIYELKRAGVEFEIIDPAEYGFMMSAVNLFTSSSEALEHTQRTQNFVDATNKGWQYALDHPSQVVYWLQTRYGVQKSTEALMYEAHALKKLMLTDFYTIGEANPELAERALKQLIQSGAVQDNQKLGTFLFKDLVAQKHHLLNLTREEKEYLLQKKKLTLCVDPDWYPLEIIQKGKHVGMAADVMKIFESQLGTPIVLVPTSSWGQSLEYTKEHKCDLLSLATPIPQREKYLNFTSPYLTLPLVMVTTNEKPFVESIRKLQGKKIGVVQGYEVGDLLGAKYPDIQIVPVSSVSDGLKRVEKGELYGYVDNLVVVSSAMQRGYVHELKVSFRFDEKDELGLGTRSDEPLLHDIFQKLVAGLDEETMQPIYNRWVATVEQVSWFDSPLALKIGLFFLAIIMIFAWRYHLLKKYNEYLLKLSTTDSLTGLWNRQKIDERLNEEQKKVGRYPNYHCSVLMIDVDHFKRINDSLGHQAGDEVLIGLAQVMRTSLRETDSIGRWGGEEFIVALPHTVLEDAMSVAENLRARVEEHYFNVNRTVTISIGVEECRPHEEVHQCINRVDGALYRAKKSGRNNVKFSGENPSDSS